jgi:hypothetical protein
LNTLDSDPRRNATPILATPLGRRCCRWRTLLVLFVVVVVEDDDDVVVFRRLDAADDDDDAAVANADVVVVVVVSSPFASALSSVCAGVYDLLFWERQRDWPRSSLVFSRILK